MSRIIRTLAEAAIVAASLAGFPIAIAILLAGFAGN
jgi:hypothetical protein